jgi:hypothetical protein
MTPFWKFCFPVLWGGGLGLATFAAWFHPESWRDGGSAMERWGSLVLWIFGTPMICRYAMRLRRVRRDHDGLTISDYRCQVWVPFEAISAVTIARGRRGAVWITVTFLRDTPLGRRATFLPRAGWAEDIVFDLRVMALRGSSTPIYR